MTKNSVLITGAAGGIGKATALALAQRGYVTFAAALNAAEVASLNALGQANLVPLELDVTSEESIARAVEFVAKHPHGGGLTALVSNAGVTYNAPLAYLTPAEIHQMIDVNFVGPVFLIRAFQPLLQAAGGRIAIVSSATALMPPPTISVYAATKCALGGLADSLRLELAAVGISVSVVEPGVVRTPMTAAGPGLLERFLGRMSQGDRGRYEKLMRKIVDMSATPKAGVPPESVTNAIVRALTDRRPKARYRVGIDCKATAVLSHLPDRTRDRIQRAIFGFK